VSAPAVLLAGPFDSTDPAAWSGTVSGLRQGLETIGARVHGLDTRVPGRRARSLLHRAERLQAQAPVHPVDFELPALQSLMARRFLARAPTYDVVVQIGSTFRADWPAPMATYEDMTLGQALSTGFLDPDSLSPRRWAAWRRRQESAYARATVCCTASDWAAASIVGDYGVEPGKVVTIGLGVDVTVADPQRDWRSPRFLFVGVDWTRKRGDAVLAAFARLHERMPEATLDVVGGHPSLSAAGVRCHGRLRRDDPADQRRLATLFADATCLVMPSSIEPFGLVYVEAGAQGIPSIGTTVGGAPEAIGPGGIVVDPSDDDGLADAMARLADPATARRLGALARDHSRRFTWPEVARRLLSALTGASARTLSP
jgi:glycosyltransferase involved in cell wall biosynthesis